MIITVIIAALISLLTPNIHTAVEPAPQHATGCTKWYSSGRGYGYCTHLDNGYEMWMIGVCMQKFGPNAYGTYSTRTSLPWTTRSVGCASGYFLNSYSLHTG
jgi:hypothetical protein